MLFVSSYNSESSKVCDLYSSVNLQFITSAFCLFFCLFICVLKRFCLLDVEEVNCSVVPSSFVSNKLTKETFLSLIF